MPPKKRSRKQTYNVKDEAASNIFLDMPTERVGTVADCLETTHPQQEPKESTGYYAAPAPAFVPSTVILPSVSRTISTASLTHSDPLSGVSWSFEPPSAPLSSGNDILY